MNDKNQKTESPSERLLEAAEALFAAKGYQQVSVRQITTAAEVNLAAVNYYFGGKKNLYHEVFRTRLAERARLARRPLEKMNRRGDFSLEEVVEALAGLVLKSPFTPEMRERHRALVIREVTNPTEAFAILQEVQFRPLMELAAGMMRRVLPAETDQRTIQLNCLSILAQALFFPNARPALEKMSEWGPEDLTDLLVRHITDFSLHGLSGAGEVP